MALAPLLACASERDALKKRDIVTYFSSFTDDHPHPMIDKESCPDRSRWVNFNPSEPTSQLGQGSRQDRHAPHFQPMSDPVNEQGMETCVGENDLIRLVAAGSRSKMA